MKEQLETDEAVERFMDDMMGVAEIVGKEVWIVDASVSRLSCVKQWTCSVLTRRRNS